MNYLERYNILKYSLSDPVNTLIDILFCCLNSYILLTGIGNSGPDRLIEFINGLYFVLRSAFFSAGYCADKTDQTETYLIIVLTLVVAFFEAIHFGVAIYDDPVVGL